MEQKKIYAQELGIDLFSKKETDYFKWFLACLLFGKPIQQEVAKRAYCELVTEGLVSPDAIIEAGWDKLVAVLDTAHYVRNNFSTATHLLDPATAIKRKNATATNLVNE